MQYIVCRVLVGLAAVLLPQLAAAQAYPDKPIRMIVAVTHLIGGSVELMFNSIPPALPHIRSGRLKLLAVAGVRRSAQLPDVPTVSEAGVPGFEATTWFGLLAPAKTPKQIVARLNELVVKVVRAPELKSQFEILGYEAVGGRPDEFAVFMRAESEKYARVVKLSGAKID